MADPVDSEPQRSPSCDALQESIHWWLVARFGLNSPRDKDIWLYCIGAAMELERMAVAVLWLDDGRPTPVFYQYGGKMTLGRAYLAIEKRGLLDASTRKVLKDVADLRNSVAHRHAVFVTIQSPIKGHPIGEYKGRQVFLDSVALAELIRDMDAATQIMYAWMAAKAPDLAEEARRSGAHPTPP